jgi:hypothetical protein
MSLLGFARIRVACKSKGAIGRPNPARTTAAYIPQGRAGPRPKPGIEWAAPLRNRWFADSPLEGSGFEPSVPRHATEVSMPLDSPLSSA